MNNKRGGWVMALSVVVVAAVIVGGGAWFAWSKNKNSAVVAPPPQNTEENTSTSAKDVSGGQPITQPTSTATTPPQTQPVPALKTYTSAGMGVSFKYPSSWLVRENEYGILGGIKDESAVAGTPDLVYYFSISSCKMDCPTDLNEIAKEAGITNANPATIGGKLALKGELQGIVIGKTVVAYAIQAGNGLVFWYENADDPAIRAGLNTVVSSIAFK